jgi:hypothetical protein
MRNFAKLDDHATYSNCRGRRVFANFLFPLFEPLCFYENGVSSPVCGWIRA